MKFGMPPPTILHVNYHAREPQESNMGINVYAHCPLHLPKVVSNKKVLLCECKRHTTHHTASTCYATLSSGWDGTTSQHGGYASQVLK